MPSASLWGACAAALSFATAATNGCGPAPAPTVPGAPPPAGPAATLAEPAPGSSPLARAIASATGGAPERDVCANDKPVPHAFEGILKVARCKQEMFLTMASLATSLGVECRYCHVPLPGSAAEEDYPVATPKKAIANWMKMHLMASIKPADGSPFRCKSCHTDPATGKPLARIFGNPRDIVRAQEWMTTVMVNKFVALDGSKLKCKSCHGANFGASDFHAKVILETAQLPPH